MFAVAAILMVVLTGDYSAVLVAKHQPAKFAAMESVWETQKGAGINIFVIPDPKRECNLVEGPCIPNLLSYLAFHTPDGEIKGLKAFPVEDRPPVTPTFISFRIMVGLGFLMLLLATVSLVKSLRGTLERHPLFLRLLVYAIPIPYVANQLGWLVAEVGRQPWIVYGVLRTSDAVSKSINATQVVISLAGFTLLYGFLGFLDVYLLTKYARKGPEQTAPAVVPAAKEV